MTEDGVAADPAELLKALIRCPSVTPEEAGALDIVQRFLEPLGFDCTRLVFEGDGSYPVDNLFATRGTGGRHLLFVGHTDVVPPGDLADWTHPPFAAHERDGIVWGRGAVDMKSGIAAFCSVLADAVADGGAGAGTISLAITNDEEADAVNGIEKLLAWAAARGHRFDFSIVGEPSSVENLGDTIKIGRRGSLNARVLVEGMQGHSAYPERARNPVPVLAAIATALGDTPLDAGSEHFQPSNIEVTSIDVGNKAANVIPTRGALRFNVRFNDNWDRAGLEAWIAARIAEVPHRGCTVAVEIVEPVSRGFVSPVGAAVETLAAAIAAETGRRPALTTTGGTSDARFVADYCPVVECGLTGATIHKVDERVALNEVRALARVYRRFIAAWLGGDS